MSAGKGDTPRKVNINKFNNTLGIVKLRKVISSYFNLENTRVSFSEVKENDWAVLSFMNHKEKVFLYCDIFYDTGMVEIFVKNYKKASFGEMIIKLDEFEDLNEDIKWVF